MRSVASGGVLCLLCFILMLGIPLHAQDEPIPESAPLLSYDQPTGGTINDASPSVAFAFDALRGEVLSVRLTVTDGNLLPMLTVSDASGTLIAASVDGARTANNAIGFDSLSIPRSERYILRVGRFGLRLGATSGDFVLLVERVGVSSASGSALRYGDSVINTITDGQTRFFYPFRGQRGDVITARLQRASGNLDPLLLLTDANGMVLAENDDAPNSGLDASIDGFLIREDGTYILVASRYAGEAGTTSGGFVLSLLSAAESGLGTRFEASYPLEYGAIVEGNLTNEQHAMYYRFTGRAGDVIRVRLERVGGALDPLIALTNANAQELVSDDDSGGVQNSLIDGFVLPANGDYTLIATRYERAAGSTTGRFRLSLERTGGATSDTPDGVPESG